MEFLHVLLKDGFDAVPVTKRTSPLAGEYTAANMTATL